MLEATDMASYGRGFVPVLGVVPDLLNDAIYSLEGDYANAGLSAGFAVPLAGDAATAVRIGSRIGRRLVTKGSTEVISFIASKTGRFQGYK